ncbi:MAG: hypothetical protein ACYTF6_12725, partial [Planctomycetota bacterium]
RDTPDFLAVFRTSLTADEFTSLARKFEAVGGALKAAGNGRYDTEPLGLRLILGSEADDLAEGIILFGPRRLLDDESLGKLGTGDNKNLRKMLKGVDTSVPCWVAVSLEFIRDEEAPAKFVGSFDPRGKGSGRGVMTFRDEQSARMAVRELADEDFPLSDLFSFDREGKVVTVRPKGEGNFVERSVQACDKSVRQARQMARRVASMSNVRELAFAVMSYSASHAGNMPESLQAVEAYLALADFPKSPLSKDKRGRQPDYIYVRFSRIAAVPHPSRTILIYERLENYDGKGTTVAFVDGHVEWVDAEKFRQLLKASQDAGGVVVEAPQSGAAADGVGGWHDRISVDPVITPLYASPPCDRTHGAVDCTSAFFENGRRSMLLRRLVAGVLTQSYRLSRRSSTWERPLWEFGWHARRVGKRTT